jgi:MFS family permease
MSAALPPPTPAANAHSMAITLQIVSIVIYTFIAFLCIGLPIAVIPGYVHDQLGFSAVIAGLTIGAQYLATLLSRPIAGRICDNIGTKRAIVYGLSGITLSGVMTIIAVLLDSLPQVSLTVLIVSRLFLGASQGLIGVGTISWCIGQVGPEHMARSISWNGIASYGAIAIGAPLGVVMVGSLGFVSLGIALTVLACGALLLIRKKPAVPVIRGERLPFWSVFGRIAPFGISLTLASIGYGTLTTFITLFYISRGWEGAAWCLTVFGVCFILARLLFINAINRFGGFRSAITCMAVETVGLVLLCAVGRRVCRLWIVPGLPRHWRGSHQASAQQQPWRGPECVCGVFRSGPGHRRPADGRHRIGHGLWMDLLFRRVVVGGEPGIDRCAVTSRGHRHTGVNLRQCRWRPVRLNPCRARGSQLHNP